MQVPAKSQDNMLLRRPPVHAPPSQEGLLDFVSEQASRGKNSLSGNEGNALIPITCIWHLFNLWLVKQTFPLLEVGMFKICYFSRGVALHSTSAQGALIFTALNFFCLCYP